MSTTKVLKTKEADYDIREFKYEDKTWADPGIEHSLQAVIDYLSQAHPAIRQAEVQEAVETRPLDDGESQRVLVVKFIKKATHKAAPLSGRDLALALEPIGPLNVTAVDVFNRLISLKEQVSEDSDMPLTPLLDMAPAIRDAMEQLSLQVRSVQNLSHQLTVHLVSIPSQTFTD